MSSGGETIHVSELGPEYKGVHQVTERMKIRAMAGIGIMFSSEVVPKFHGSETSQKGIIIAGGAIAASGLWNGIRSLRREVLLTRQIDDELYDDEEV